MEAPFLPLAAHQPAILLRNGLNAPQAKAMPFLWFCIFDGEAIFPKRHRLRAGIRQRTYKVMVIREVDLQADNAFFLWVAMAGIDGVFESVCQNNANIHFIIQQLFGKADIRADVAIILLRQADIRGEHGIYGRIGAPILRSKAVQPYS